MHKKYPDTMKLFSQMALQQFKPDFVTYVVVLVACAEVKDFNMGKSLHSQLSKHNGWLGIDSVHNALISMYVKCGAASVAEQVSFFYYYNM